MLPRGTVSLPWPTIFRLKGGERKRTRERERDILEVD